MELSINITTREVGSKAKSFTHVEDLNGQMTIKRLLEVLQGTISSSAINALAEEQGKGFDKTPVITVDGRRNVDMRAVSPTGKIEIDSRISTGVLLPEILQLLIDYSAIDTGQYISSHVIVIGDHLIKDGMQGLTSWLSSGNSIKETDSVYFVNVMPYASRLEREGITRSSRAGNAKMGKSKDPRKRAANSQGMVRQPNGTYFRAARKIKSKYGAILYASFKFLQLGTLNLAGPTRGSISGKRLRNSFDSKNKKYKGPYVYPAIRVRLKYGGSKDE